MKQVTYTIRGMVIETMIPAIAASCESLAGVKNVRIQVADTDSATLTLTLAEEVSPTLERDLAAIMNTKGLELILPALSEADSAAPVSPAPSETASRAASVGEPAAPPPSEGTRFVAAPPPKQEKKIGLTAAVSTVITAVVLAVLLTFSLTTAYMRNSAPNAVTPGQETEEGPFDQLEILDRLFRSATMLEELDEQAIIEGVLRGYVAATGDLYAQYYNAEELKELTSSQNGEMCGIGVSVTRGTVTVDGVSYVVITVFSVNPESPAEAAGVQPGDHIFYVGAGDERATVNAIGYDEALNRMAGEEGTECAFTVYRPTEAEPYVDFTITRKKITTHSVIPRVHDEDPTVGIIRLTGFDHTTRPQFEAAVEDLKAKGCQYFVLDLRGNPGGLLTSVEDVLIYFLQVGDTVISTKDCTGAESVTKIALDSQGRVTCGSGELTEEDVGKYRDLKISVLVNEYSASAAELFTANIRDYGLGKTVGVKTYGKGSMQTTFLLSKYGYDGALKLTTAYYYPPCGEGYDGIGITPDVVVELSEEALEYNINILPDGLDNQLTAAIETMK